MKMINRLVLATLLFCFSIGVKAHNPDISSTLLVEQSEGKWIIQIRAALTAFEYEVESSFGKDAYKTPERFQQLVLDHVKERAYVSFDQGDQIELQNGIVKLGHETSVSFELLGTPNIYKFVDVKNSTFSDIPRNKGALILMKKGFAREQFTIDKTNGHTIKLKVADSKFVEVNQQKESNQSEALAIVFSILILSLIVYLILKTRKVKDSSLVLSNS